MYSVNIWVCWLILLIFTACWKFGKIQKNSNADFLININILQTSSPSKYQVAHLDVIVERGEYAQYFFSTWKF